MHFDMEERDREYVIEEKWNAISHGFGIVLSVIGTFYLFLHSNSLSFFPSVFIYCLSLILLFSASTLYHSFYQPRLKKKLRVLDHISIYYLIAGTYTPVCLTLLKDSKGILLLIAVWSIAIFGTILKIFFTGKYEVFSLILYGIMGWLIIVDVDYLVNQATNLQLVYLTMGGVFYTVGILFYAVKKIPFNHLIWHFFVLAGAISHFLLICSLV